MFCTECGSEVDESSRYCSKCGAAQEKSEKVDLNVTYKNEGAYDAVEGVSNILKNVKKSVVDPMNDPTTNTVKNHDIENKSFGNWMGIVGAIIGVFIASKGMFIASIEGAGSDLFYWVPIGGILGYIAGYIFGFILSNIILIPYKIAEKNGNPYAGIIYWLSLGSVLAIALFGIGFLVWFLTLVWSFYTPAERQTGEQ